MGMLDGLLSNVLGGILGGGGAQGAQSPLVQAALQLLQENGGVSGVIDKFRQAGYGTQADSWVSTGQNQAIGADALQQVLGSGALSDAAAKLGMSDGAVAGGLASVLPQVIDRLTPQGSIPENHGDLVTQALALLRKSA